MASAERHPLDRLPAALEWHEAVAIVQEIATRAIAGETGIVHRAADVVVDSEGQLILPNAGSVPVFGALKSARATQDLADLRTLLHELLPKTTIPPALAVLADAANANAGVTSIAEFSKALSFFERPNRARDLKVVAARLAAASEQLTLQERLADLTRKARPDDHREAYRVEPVSSADPQPEPPAVSQPEAASSPFTSELPELEPGADFLSEADLAKPRAVPRAHQRNVAFEIKKQIEGWLPDARTTALVAGILCLLTVVAIGGYAFVNRPSSEIDRDGDAAAAPGNTQPGSTLAVEKTTGSSTRAKTRAANAPALAPTTAARKTTDPERQQTARTESVADNAAGPAVAASSEPPPSSDSRVSSTAATPSPILPLSGDPARVGQPLFMGSAILDSTLPTWDGVYDSRHSQVKPARLLRPQLPEIPANTPMETLGVFEFVVSMRGTVERIRLVRSPSDRQYRDIMLMPAAKAWIFQPATRDGSPVRYRLQILIPQ